MDDQNKKLFKILVVVLIWTVLEIAADHSLLEWHESSHERICNIYNGTSEKHITLFDGNVTCTPGSEGSENILYFFSWQETVMYHLQGFIREIWFLGLFVILAIFIKDF